MKQRNSNIFIITAVNFNYNKTATPSSYSILNAHTGQYTGSDKQTFEDANCVNIDG